VEHKAGDRKSNGKKAPLCPRVIMRGLKFQSTILLLINERAGALKFPPASLEIKTQYATKVSGSPRTLVLECLNF
jgi:hypothetical protein